MFSDISTELENLKKEKDELLAKVAKLLMENSNI
jgi:hypothetical protein